MKFFFKILYREYLLSIRDLSDVLNPLLFFIIVVTLFPLAIGPEISLLKSIAPGIIWVTILLANLLSVNRLFLNDFRDGCLEQFYLSDESLTIFVFAKLCLHCLFINLPLICLTPVLGTAFHLTHHEIFLLLLSIFIASPIVTALVAFGSSLTLSGKNGGVILSLLVLPLLIPVLIFSSGIVWYSSEQVFPIFAMLLAILLVSLLVFPVLISSVIGISIKNK